MSNPNTPAFWDKLIRTCDSIPSGDHITRDRIQRISRLIPNARSTVLDIGTGYGFMESELITKQRVSIYGIDISPLGIARMKKKFRGTFLVGSGVAHPFDDQIFDYILILEVLEHLNLSDGRKTLKESWRTLKQGGKLIVSVPLYDRVYRGHPSGHIREITPKQIQDEIVSCGFKITKVEYLYAFKNLYWFKSVANNLLKIKKPNIAIILATK